MTRKEALAELIAKVEAGEASGKFGPIMRGHMDFDKILEASRAYNGSLDAAKALHEAVLPGWAVERITMWPGPNNGCAAYLWGTHEKRGERWHHPEDGRSDATAETPARAWLLAILRALHSMEGEQ